MNRVGVLAGLFVLLALGVGPRPGSARLSAPTPRSWLVPVELSRTLLRVSPGRVARQVEHGLPPALESIARSLRTGASLVQAVREASEGGGTVAADLRRVIKSVDRGVDLRSALVDWREERQRDSVALAVAGLVLASDAGSPARTVDEMAVVLRERLALAAEVRALASQARASAMVIGGAPIGFMAFMVVIDPGRLGAIVTTPLGAASIALGVLLDAAGMMWMRQITGSVGHGVV